MRSHQSKARGSQSSSFFFALILGVCVWSFGADRSLWTDAPRFSFTVDGKAFAATQPSTQSETIDATRVRRRAIWNDRATGLQVRVVGVEYLNFPVVEWTVFLKNTASADSGVIESLRPIDAVLKTSVDA